jgi:hypothetical protein
LGQRLARPRLDIVLCTWPKPVDFLKISKGMDQTGDLAGLSLVYN